MRIDYVFSGLQANNALRKKLGDRFPYAPVGYKRTKQKRDLST